MSMRSYVSFAEIKAKVPIPDVLDILGIADGFERKGDTLTGVCPLPSHKHGPQPNARQFKINCREGVWLWHCFGDCQRGGDVIELVKGITGHSNAHVRLWFAQHFGERLQTGQRSTQVEKDTAHDSSRGRGKQSQAASSAPSNLPDAPVPLKPLRFKLNLDPDVPYLRQRGLTAETIQRFGLGLCSRGLLKGYVAIPIYGHDQHRDENPLAYLGRWPGEDYDESAGRPRYRWPEGFPKSQVVYGLADALHDTEGKPLIVVEGPFAVYHLAQNGFSNAVALFGSSLSDEQAAILVGAGRHIVLMFDGDGAGQEGMQIANTTLISHTFVRAAILDNDTQPTDLHADELNALLS